MENRTILDELRTDKRPTVIFGAATAGRKIYYELKIKATAEKELYFCDNYKQGIEPVTGGRIITPEELAARYADTMVCVCIITSSYRQDVCRQLKEMGFSSEQIVEYPQLAEALLAEHGGAVSWKYAENSFDWTENHQRIAKMSQWIEEEDHSVIDLGAGDCYLKQCLRPGVKYIPTDYIARTPEHIVFDFNSDLFPDIKADVCFLGFTLYYVKDWSAFLHSVCKATSHKVIIGIGIQVPGAGVYELNGKKKIFYSDGEIIRVMSEQGFALKENHFEQLGDGRSYNHQFMLFVRIR